MNLGKTANGLAVESVFEFFKTGVPLFSGLGEEGLRALAEFAEPCFFDPGHTIIRQGESVDFLYIISRGKAFVTLRRGRHAEPLRIAELGRGDLFGEMSLIERGLANATVRTEEQSSVFLVPGSVVLEVFDRDPELKSRLLDLAAARRRVIEELLAKG